MGIKKSVTKQGDNKTFPKRGQTVTVHYKGRLTNGKQFDTSVGREPFKFQIGAGRVIRGWDEGVASMSLGEISTFMMTPEYGYGAAGAGADIPPNSTLIFDIQLLAIN